LHQIEKGTPSPAFCELVHHVSSFMEEMSGGSCTQHTRFGHALHAENMQTSQELNVFYWSIYDLKDKFSPLHWHQSNTVFTESLPPLKKQIGFLYHLIPHHTRSNTLTAMIHHWIDPLPLPLLAAYHRLNIKIGTWSGSSYTEQSKKNRTYHRSYRDTPEAI